MFILLMRISCKQEQVMISAGMYTTKIAEVTACSLQCSAEPWWILKNNPHSVRSVATCLSMQSPTTKDCSYFAPSCSSGGEEEMVQKK